MTHNLTLHGCSIDPIGQVRESTVRKVGEKAPPVDISAADQHVGSGPTAKVAREVEVVAAAR